MTPPSKPKECICLKGWPHVIGDGEYVALNPCCPCECHKRVCMFCGEAAWVSESSSEVGFVHSSCKPFYILYKKLK